MRTSMDRITRQPLMIQLGGTEYPFHPKCIRDAEMWRKELYESVSGIEDVVGKRWDSMEELVARVEDTIILEPDVVLTLLQNWEPDLEWDTIKQEAYDNELNAALMEVLAVAFPFFGASLARMTKGAREIQASQ